MRLCNVQVHPQTHIHTVHFTYTPFSGHTATMQKLSVYTICSKNLHWKSHNDLTKPCDTHTHMHTETHTNNNQENHKNLMLMVRVGNVSFKTLLVTGAWFRLFSFILSSLSLHFNAMTFISTWVKLWSNTPRWEYNKENERGKERVSERAKEKNEKFISFWQQLLSNIASWVSCIW